MMGIIIHQDLRIKTFSRELLLLFVIICYSVILLQFSHSFFWGHEVSHGLITVLIGHSSKIVVTHINK